MQRGSDKHGPRLDDALEKETRGLVQGGGETHAEEWKSAEPPGEQQPADEAERRAELASRLGKEIWPAEGSTIKQALSSSSPPDWLRSLVTSVPDGRVYDNVAEVWHDLTGYDEPHRF